MKAYMIVEPTNLKPLPFSSFDKASESAVRAGIAAGVRGRLSIGLPFTCCQRNAEKLPHSFCNARKQRALTTADSIFSRFRTMPGLRSRVCFFFVLYLAIFFGSKPSNALR